MDASSDGAATEQVAGEVTAEPVQAQEGSGGGDLLPPTPSAGLEVEATKGSSNVSATETSFGVVDSCTVPLARRLGFYNTSVLGECLYDEVEEEEGKDSEEKSSPKRPSVIKTQHSTDQILPLEQYKRVIAEQLEEHIEAKRTEQEELLYSTNDEVADPNGAPAVIQRPKRVPPPDDE